MVHENFMRTIIRYYLPWSTNVCAFLILFIMRWPFVSHCLSSSKTLSIVQHYQRLFHVATSPLIEPPSNGYGYRDASKAGCCRARAEQEWAAAWDPGSPSCWLLLGWGAQRWFGGLLSGWLVYCIHINVSMETRVPTIGLHDLDYELCLIIAAYCWLPLSDRWLLADCSVGTPSNQKVGDNMRVYPTSTMAGRWSFLVADFINKKLVLLALQCWEDNAPETAMCFSLGQCRNNVINISRDK